MHKIKSSLELKEDVVDDINEHIKAGDGETSKRVNKFSIDEIPTENPLNSTPLHESEQSSSSPACSLHPPYTTPQQFFTGIKICTHSYFMKAMVFREEKYTK